MAIRALRSRKEIYFDESNKLDQPGIHYSYYAAFRKAVAGKLVDLPDVEEQQLVMEKMEKETGHTLKNELGSSLKST